MKYKSILFASFLFASSLFAEDARADSSDAPLSTTFDFSQGYRNDSLKITPGRDSKVHFKNIDVYTSRLGVTLMKNDFFLKGIAGYGNVYDGKYNTERAYYGTNNTMSFHRNVKDHYTADFILELGKNFKLQDGWSIAPKIGYGLFVQKFETDSKVDLHYRGQTKTIQSAKTGITTTWYSPFVGLNVQKVINQSVSAFLSYDFLFPMNYRAKYSTAGKTRLLTENTPYKAFGHIGTVGLDWKVAKGWSLKPEFEMMNLISRDDHGHGYGGIIKKTERAAYEARLTLGYSF
jgi:hypothetical protein